MTTIAREKTMTTISQRERLKDELIYRSWKDEAFRAELMANPVSVLEREYPEAFPDGKVPSDLDINVVTEGKGTLYIVLPAKPDIMERSDLGGDVFFNGYCSTTVRSTSVGNGNTKTVGRP